MNLPQIQTELFRELVGIGELLNSECSTRITKDIDTSVNFELYDFSKVKTSGKWRRVMFRRVDPRKITTYDQITAEINRIWNEISAECKREDILKTETPNRSTGLLVPTTTKQP